MRGSLTRVRFNDFLAYRLLHTTRATAKPRAENEIIQLAIKKSKS
jgi:hypothetical protein